MKKILGAVPTPFWFYFLPMLAGTFGLIPQSHPLYPFLSSQLLPVCLVLLLIGTDLRAVARMGGLSFFLMLSGMAGTVLGGIVSYRLYQPWLPPGTWGGIGALAGSWTGGSANMIAVKEALQVPDSIIGPLIIVDAGVAYSWMALLVWSSSLQERWNAWVANGDVPPSGRVNAVRSSSQRDDSLYRLARSRLETSSQANRARSLGEAGFSRAPQVAVAIALSLSISLAAQFISRRLPTPGPAFSTSTWTVILVTTAALILSLTPLRKLEEAGVSRLGTWALYLLLASIGARADLRAILHTPVFLALGVTWVLIHGLCLLAAGRLLRAPLGLIAVASQANIGGTVSTPIVGATFSPELAGIGLLMAILGNLLGTYIGLATALMVRKLV